MSILNSKLWYRAIRGALRWSILFSFTAVAALTSSAFAADKLYAIYTAHSLSHVYPWIAQESGIFKEIRSGGAASLCPRGDTRCGDDTNRR